LNHTVLLIPFRSGSAPGQVLVLRVVPTQVVPRCTGSTGGSQAVCLQRSE